MDTKIVVSGLVNWVSQDKKCVALAGFGFYYVASVPTSLVKGDYVTVNLRLWEKKTDNTTIKRFYEVV